MNNEFVAFLIITIIIIMQALSALFVYKYMSIGAGSSLGTLWLMLDMLFIIWLVKSDD